MITSVFAYLNDKKISLQNYLQLVRVTIALCELENEEKKRKLVKVR